MTLFFRRCSILYSIKFSACHVYLCKGIQCTDGFWIPTRGFRIPTRGFRIPTRGFRIPTRGFRIPTRGFRIPTRGFLIPMRGFRIPTCGFWIPTRGSRIPRCWFRIPSIGFRMPRIPFYRIQDSGFLYIGRVMDFTLSCFWQADLRRSRSITYTNWVCRNDQKPFTRQPKGNGNPFPVYVNSSIRDIVVFFFYFVCRDDFTCQANSFCPEGYLYGRK